MMKPRPEVEWFAEKMEERLSDNDHKAGWENCSFTELLFRLKDEVGEVEYALINRDNIVYECADVANFAMMIAENAVNKK